MMSNTRYKLHWVTVFVEVLEMLKTSILPLIAVLFVNSRNTSEASHWLLAHWNTLLFGALLLFMLVSSLIKWRRFEYWFEDDELRIASGLFVKKKRYIPFERIQSLDHTEGIFHRPFNLVKVKVETAGGASEVKAELTAVTKAAAERVEHEMLAAKRRKQTQAIGEGLEKDTIDDIHHVPTKPIFSMTTKDLLILATTSGGIGLIVSGTLLFLSQLAEAIPYERMFERISHYITQGFVIIILAVMIGLFVVWLISVAMTFFSYYQFTVRLVEDDIIITRGLLEKKSATIPLNRVQAVRVIENPFRQLFGYATVVIDNAGGGIGEGATINLFPLIKRSMISGPLKEIFPELMMNELIQQLPRHSRRYYFQLHFIWMLPVVGVLLYYFYPYALFSLLIIPLIVSFGLWRHRSGAYGLSDKQLVLQFRRFNLHTAYLKKHRIQSMQMKQTVFQRRKGVASISARIKSGMVAYHAELKHMRQDEAEHLLRWYKPRERSNVSTTK